MYHDDIMNISMITTAVVVLIGLSIFACIAVKIQKRREEKERKKSREAEQKKLSQISELKERNLSKRHSHIPHTPTRNATDKPDNNNRQESVYNNAYEDNEYYSSVDMNKKQEYDNTTHIFTQTSKTCIYEVNTDITHNNKDYTKDHNSRPSSSNSRVINVQDKDGMKEHSTYSSTCSDGSSEPRRSSPASPGKINQHMQIDFDPQS